MAFNSEFSSVSTTSRYGCVCKWELVFCGDEGWAMFPFAYVDVYALCDFHGVCSGSERCGGVCMDCVVRSRGSSLM
jgi:hypothetical protein